MRDGRSKTASWHGHVPEVSAHDPLPERSAAVRLATCRSTRLISRTMETFCNSIQNHSLISPSPRNARMVPAPHSCIRDVFGNRARLIDLGYEGRLSSDAFDQSPLPLIEANSVDAFPVRDAVDPCGKSRGVVETIEATYRGNPGFLDDIAGSVRAAQDAAGITQQFGCPAPSQSFECLV